MADWKIKNTKRYRVSAVGNDDSPRTRVKFFEGVSFEGVVGGGMGTILNGVAATANVCGSIVEEFL